MDWQNKFNTPLKGGFRSAYNRWVSRQKAIVPPDYDLTSKDYDLRGWWKAHGADKAPDLVEGVHLNDTFKKPNHPTFSNESIYNGVEGYHGGEWIPLTPDQSKWVFRASYTNVSTRSPQELQEYFKRAEPGNHLIMPTVGKRK